MAASDHLHPQQLAMFGLGSDVKNMVSTSGDLYHEESMDQLWSRKESESREPKDSGHGSGVYDALKEKGYASWAHPVPITYSGGTFLEDGHHRVAAAAALEREGKNVWIPLVHSDDSQPSRQRNYFGQRKQITPVTGPVRRPQRKPDPKRDAAIEKIGKHFE